MNDFEELRRLLLAPEQEQLRELIERIGNREKRVQDVSGVLAQAIMVCRERPEHIENLERALAPTVSGAVNELLTKRKSEFIRDMSPLLGPLVRTSIADALRGLFQSMNETLEHTFSWQGVKWRFEALRTGKSFAEIVLLRSLVYRVEQCILMHKETGLPLLSVSSISDDTDGGEMAVGLLSAMRDVSRDAFRAKEHEELDEFRVGELQMWVVAGRAASIVVAIRGTPPRELRNTIEVTLENIHILKGAELANFEGDSAVFEPVRPELETCLQAQYAPRKREKGSYGKVWVALVTVTALIVAGPILLMREMSQWDDFLHRLEAEPGLAVTDSEFGWIWNSRIAGLRDPLAADPIPIAESAGVDPARVEFQWKPYLGLDTKSVARRFRQQFPLPEGVNVRINGNIAELVGSAPYEWIEKVRRDAFMVPGVLRVRERGLKIIYDPALVMDRLSKRFPIPEGLDITINDGTLSIKGKVAYEWIDDVRRGATEIPGIKQIDESNAEVVFDPALVVQRFGMRFGLPDTVSVDVKDGLLTVSGEASHAWLGRMRGGATSVPGIEKVREQNLVDLDMQTFRQSKSVIESAYVYFLNNKDNFATEGFAALSRLPDEIRKCLTAARRLGQSFTLEIRGSADAVGDSVRNVDLSNRRSLAVKNFLVECGLEESAMRPLGLGAPPAPLLPGEKPTPEQSNRRVSFRVLSE